MSYQSIKRVLGETHLERKCRLLFGLCLLLLIAGAFSWVWIRTENLIHEKDRRTGALLVDAIMLKTHWNDWEKNEELKNFVGDITSGLQGHQNYKYEFLTLKEGQVMRVQNRIPMPIEEPAGEGGANQGTTTSDLDVERAYLIALKEELNKRFAEEQELLLEKEKKAKEDAQQGTTTVGESPASPTAGSGGDTAPLDPNALAANSATDPARKKPPLFRERWVKGQNKNLNEYHYYSPVDWAGWEKSCTTCHSVREENTAAMGSAGVAIVENRPFRVVKVIIPDRETNKAINRNRAILIATAIITVFLAMIALYLIVRYVVVKPLKHLRDVSDEISRGNTALRADLHTGDEFEDLATSFNRMLRRLVDTQDELRDKTFDLDAKVDELAQLNMQLYEMNRLKSDFLANMSHELRTPLNSIIGFSEVLQGIKGLDDKQKRYAINIQRSGRSLLEMINDILDLAKMESGKMNVRPVEFHIEGLIHAQCDMVRSMTEKKNIELSVDSDPTMPSMYQDQGKVQQILTNLLSNAIKFTPEGGSITVVARRTGADMLDLSVVDTGVGIAVEDRDTIFEKFRQGSMVSGDNNLTREYSGTGLGLSIAKELSILLGGDITFESETGRGTQFKVSMPWVYRQGSGQIEEVDRQMHDMAHLSRADFTSTSTSTGTS